MWVKRHEDLVSFLPQDKTCCPLGPSTRIDAATGNFMLPRKGGKRKEETTQNMAVACRCCLRPDAPDCPRGFDREDIGSATDPEHFLFCVA